jgi:hypothetical protein
MQFGSSYFWSNHAHHHHVFDSVSLIVNLEGVHEAVCQREIPFDPLRLDSRGS